MSDRMLNRARHLLDMQDMHLRSYQSQSRAMTAGHEWAQTEMFEKQMLSHFSNSIVFYEALDEVCDAISIVEVLVALTDGGQYNA